MHNLKPLKFRKHQQILELNITIIGEEEFSDLILLSLLPQSG